jgi:hypothetical protein
VELREGEVDVRELEAIQSEKRAILNLFLSVIILGLLLNCLVSVFFAGAGAQLVERYWLLLVCVLIGATLVAAGITVRWAILRPIGGGGEYPTLVVVDSARNEAPVPLVMSVERERVLEGGPPPFPILARKLYRLAGTDRAGQSVDENSRDLTLGGLAEEIVEFAILHWYRQKHWVQWAVGAEYRHVGPCGPFGWSPDRPVHKLPVSNLSNLAGTGGYQNRFLRLCYHSGDKHFVLPPGMSLKLGPHGAARCILFSSNVLDLLIRVSVAGGVGGAYNFALWDRRFTADPEDMFAHQVMVRYEVSVHEAFHRYVPARLLDLPLICRLKPEATVGELYAWAEEVVDGVQDYLTWYQDEAAYADSEVMEFEREDNDGRIVYRFREPNGLCSSIAF